MGRAHHGIRAADVEKSAWQIGHGLRKPILAHSPPLPIPGIIGLDSSQGNRRHASLGNVS